MSVGKKQIIFLKKYERYHEGDLHFISKFLRAYSPPHAMSPSHKYDDAAGFQKGVDFVKLYNNNNNNNIIMQFELFSLLNKH